MEFTNIKVWFFYCAGIFLLNDSVSDHVDAQDCVFIKEFKRVNVPFLTPVLTL